MYGFSVWIYSSEFLFSVRTVFSRLVHLIVVGDVKQTATWGHRENNTCASFPHPGQPCRVLCFTQSCTCVLPPSHLFPGSSLVGYNAGSQPALQTDGPLIRCASALPLLPAARFLIKLKPKEEQAQEIYGERNRVRKKQWEVEEGRVLGSILACFGGSYLFE